MKKRSNILILFTILFIYFIFPKNVFAEVRSINCICQNTRQSFGFELTLTLNGTNGNTATVVWPGSGSGTVPSGWPASFKTTSGQINNGGKFTLSSGAPNSSALNCPASVVAESISTRNGSVKEGRLFLYDSNYSSEAQNFNADINLTGTVDGSNRSAFESAYPAKSEYLTCKKEVTQNAADATGQEKNSLNDDWSATDELTETTEENAANNEKDQERKKQAVKEENPTPEFPAPEHQSCEDVFGNTTDKTKVAWILQNIFNYAKLFGILLSVIFSAIDFTKVLLSNDADQMKKAQKKLIMRVIAIIILLILPSVINLLLGLFISGNFDFSCGIR